MVTIKTRIDGQIMTVAFTEGEEVKAGDPLIEIDPRPYQAALEIAQANKAKDEAQLVSADADLHRFVTLLTARRLLRDLEPENQRTTLNELLHTATRAWHGVKLFQPDWSPWSHSLAFSDPGL